MPRLDCLSTLDGVVPIQAAHVSTDCDPLALSLQPLQPDRQSFWALGRRGALNATGPSAGR